MIVDEQNAIPDVQNRDDERNLVIQKVGIRRIKYPFKLLSQEGSISTIGEWSLAVTLPENKKGTHMSRFVNLLQTYKDHTFTLSEFKTLCSEMTDLLEADRGFIETQFTFFVQKEAPISKVVSLMEYAVKWGVSYEKSKNSYGLSVEILIPVMSLCPCSKEISDYGAHNQRSHITVTLYGDLCEKWESVIAIVEGQSSSPLWGLLKRSDEKFVTEHSYDNPKFVEDLIRDVARALKSMQGNGRFDIQVENFESIHNHSAFAQMSINAGYL